MCDGGAVTTSPESYYAGPVGKDLGDLSLETPLGRRQTELDEAARDAMVNDAARVLQDMHNSHMGGSSSNNNNNVNTAKVNNNSNIENENSRSVTKKRSRPLSMDNSSVQENVRELLNGRFYTRSSETGWSEDMVRQRNYLGGSLAGANSASNSGDVNTETATKTTQIPVRSTQNSDRKRICCSVEASRHFAKIPSLHPAVGGMGGPGMWEGVLN
jgi:hypothetical protein